MDPTNVNRWTPHSSTRVVYEVALSNEWTTKYISARYGSPTDSDRPHDLIRGSHALANFVFALSKLMQFGIFIGIPTHKPNPEQYPQCPLTASIQWQPEKARKVGGLLSTTYDLYPHVGLTITSTLITHSQRNLGAFGGIKAQDAPKTRD